jgi:hypothetical protein
MLKPESSENKSAYYPPVGFHFSVQIGGESDEKEFRFQEVSGLTAEIGTEELQVGGEKQVFLPPAYQGQIW